MRNHDHSRVVLHEVLQSRQRGVDALRIENLIVSEGNVQVFAQQYALSADVRIFEGAQH